jgi:bacillithiol biosynthesis cysteine-adding enzyme BshC
VSRPFSSSYLASEPAARAFLADDFRDPSRRAARTRAAAARRAPPELVAVLRAQQASLTGSPAVAAHLDALGAGNTAVVATGQQVGLFLGPLYGFYKAAAAVAVARALAAESGVRCVPLFWLQTEDHDFAEIAAATVADRDGKPRRLALADDDARISIAHRVLGPEIAGLLDELGEALPAGPAADETLALLRAHYRPGQSPAAAFAGALSALFAEDGLLILDPRDARVAALAAPVYRRTIGEAPALEAALTARVAALGAAGFETQIEIRSGCALLFFHRGGVAGPRYRLQRDGEGDGWILSGCEEDAVSDEALLSAIDREPLRLSTSALLRPIVQDSILPTAAYVGGPGELNYFAQLGPLFAHFGLPPPLVVPRARFRCVDARTRRLLGHVGLAPDDVGRPRRELYARLAPADTAPAGLPDPSAVRAQLAAQIEAADALARSLATAVPSLARAAARTRGTVAHALTRLADRYARALAERDGVLVDRLDRLEAALCPGGVPQERAYAWPSLAGRIGPIAFKRLVTARLGNDPFTTQIHDLEP